MMRPQTRNPTSHAAIHEPFQSVMIRPVWSVVEGVDGSHPVSRWFSHPERTRAAPTPAVTTAVRRLLPRCARTTSCERNAGLPTLSARRLELPGLDRPRTHRTLPGTAPRRPWRAPPPGASDLPPSGDAVPAAGDRLTPPVPAA